MSLNDLTYKFKEFWKEFKRDKTGIVGLCILSFAILVVIFEPFLLPQKGTNEHWRRIQYWEDFPVAVPPVWTNWFTTKKAAVTLKLNKPEISKIEHPEFGNVYDYAFKYHYKYAKAPVDIIFRLDGKVGSVFFNAVLERPDGHNVLIGQFQYPNVNNDSIRFSVHHDAKNAIQGYMRQFGATPTSGNARPTELLFSKAEKKMYRNKEPLEGDYVFHVYFSSEREMNAENPRIIIQGAVSGIMGTDTHKRDIFSGIIAGLKWALIIGLVTSIISVVIGLIYGVICAYFGGWVDASMQFIAEIFLSMPIMPVLIVIFATTKPSIWYIIFAIVVVGWVGPVKTIRSMALQIREETYVEAGKALGAGHWRLIFKHIIPILLPYSFAAMATSVPGYIVYEASLSMLGLGDSTIVSWGQILQDARAAGASLNGLWWWIIPPGLCISLMGMTFAFIGFSLDKILYPKLQKR